MTTRRERAHAARTMRQTMDATARARAAEAQAREARQREAQARAELRELARRDDRTMRIEFTMREDPRLAAWVIEAHARQHAISRAVPWDREDEIEDAVRSAAYQLAVAESGGIVHAMRSDYQRPRWRSWADR